MVPLMAAAAIWAAISLLAEVALRLATIRAALVPAFIGGIRREFGFGVDRASTRSEIAGPTACFAFAGPALVSLHPDWALPPLALGFLLAAWADRCGRRRKRTVALRAVAAAADAPRYAGAGLALGPASSRRTRVKLYYAPGACSLADHIALHEAGLDFEHERVDLKSKRTEHGDDFKAVNPKGYVPALRLDSGEVLTENVAVLDWIADQSATLKPEGPLGRTRQTEALAYIGGEVHKAFAPMFKGGSDEEKEAAKRQVAQKLELVAGTMKGPYLFGDRPGVADFYLFVMLTWATKMGIDIPEPLVAMRDRLMERDSVRTAMAHEGLLTV